MGRYYAWVKGTVENARSGGSLISIGHEMKQCLKNAKKEFEGKLKEDLEQFRPVVVVKVHLEHPELDQTQLDMKVKEEMFALEKTLRDEFKREIWPYQWRTAWVIFRGVFRIVLAALSVGLFIWIIYASGHRT